MVVKLPRPITPGKCGQYDKRVVKIPRLMKSDKYHQTNHPDVTVIKVPRLMRSDEYHQTDKPDDICGNQKCVTIHHQVK